MNVFIINDCKFVVCKCNMRYSYCDISRSKLASRTGYYASFVLSLHVALYNQSSET